MNLTRRLALGGLAAAAFAPSARAAPDPIAAIERRYGGRLGVFALDTGTGRALAHRADERFILCSSFKALLAALVLHRVDLGHEDLEASIRIRPSDPIGYSPVTRAHLAAGHMSVRDLCVAAVEQSDNGAANLLLHRVGGPQAVTAFLRSIGDPTTRLDRFEMALNHRDGVLDTTTPRAVSLTTGTLLLGDALQPASRALLEGWMVDCRTGLHRLRASFPTDWVAADKTGTGDGETNDFAMVRRPYGAPLVMAAYYDRRGMDNDLQEAALREVGTAIVAWAAT